MNLRERIFRVGVAILAADIALYLIGVVHISLMVGNQSQLGHTLHIAALYFVFGSFMALVAAILSCFGYGWKRFLPALASLVTLPFWYGLTCY